ncbi:hypothetical protein SAMN05892883_2062 [Jatrophihabitans sp. GAS493]|uniref:hypothetical protein n=1 Tax=Jatrophihabitans sp. GAS493 TaxID=1907575 RepID=UPI000BC01C85|nr:hypothetical protein [Jatrophihabitans sp. GAS493]SOD72711.1 hypothetical protein SAMN05892883_2062 [Jatrophihabitans sp. GAS493]
MTFDVGTLAAWGTLAGLAAGAARFAFVQWGTRRAKAEAHIQALIDEAVSEDRRRAEEARKSEQIAHLLEENRRLKGGS